LAWCGDKGVGMETFRTLVLLVVALIHLAPGVGVLSSARLRQLYGVAPQDPTLLLLMRHRAVLFAILGAGFFAAAFQPGLHGPALLAAAAALGSFLTLAGRGTTRTAHIRRLVAIDATVLLGVIAAGGSLLM